MVTTILTNQHLAVVLCVPSYSHVITRCLLIRNYKCIVNLMPCDKDFDYVRVSKGLTCNLWMLW